MTDPIIPGKTNTAVRKRISLRIAGVGTAFQIERRRRAVERVLRRYAEGLRSEANSVDRIAAKLQADREAGLRPHRQDLANATRAYGLAKYRVKEFVGLNGYCDDRDLWDAFEGRVRPRAEEPPVNAQSDEATSAEPVAVNAFNEAAAIARSAAGEELDWSREPLTERERQLRALWIKKHLEHRWSLGASMIDSKISFLRLRGKPIPSDLAAAAPLAAQREKELRAAEQRADLQDLADELDGKDLESEDDS